MVKNNSRTPTTHGSVGVAEQIQSNLSKPKSCKKRQYKGVRMRSWGSWVSEIRAPNQKTRIWLGSYATPEAAARAYDAALLCLKGSSANLNFPITPSTHFPDTIMSPKSIQRVAAAAAASTNIATPPSSPTPTPPPYSSSSSSPSDDRGEISTPCSENYSASKAEDPPCSVDPWIDLGGLLSPKYADQMLDPCALFAPPTMEECDEEGGVDLWTFY
ncbi:hypothetical protein MRB53_000295 [Persea americana]|uniref:Uncharacterized protein n=1 Tax=Persea americana TaxID=3435 RepID=A0ACC2MNH6_PERAE|nr:hypothetical protein MRB53_000295 [Persea americana]